MRRHAPAKRRPSFITWLYIGIPVILAVAAPLHFLYEWTGKLFFIGLITPVNESPWEHLKLAFWPILIWWTAVYRTAGRKTRYPFVKAAVSCAVAEGAALFFILAFYYICAGAFGTESLAVNIAAMLLALIIGVRLAVHVAARSSPGDASAFAAVLAVIVLAALFVLFTVYPPHLPLFLDRTTGEYGIAAAV
jgi:hypothetical protein